MSASKQDTPKSQSKSGYSLQAKATGLSPKLLIQEDML
jgi:hypothetical protein